MSEEEIQKEETSSPIPPGNSGDAEKWGRIYDQWCEDFRSLQNVFWRVPFFAMTITGGIGAAVIAFDGAFEVKRLLLGFTAVCNFILIMIAWRIRRIMEQLLIKIYDYEGKKKPKTGFFVLKCFSAMFGIVGALTLWVAVFPGDLLAPNSSTNAEEKNCSSITVSRR